MMVPVGRIILARTFARSELVRAMSFVAIPALIGPMIGPLAGGVIVGLSHWRMIFFVNIPIGMLGLYLVYKYLPDYRVGKTHKHVFTRKKMAKTLRNILIAVGRLLVRQLDIEADTR